MTRRRKPARTASPTVRQLIDIIDASGETYCAVCCRTGLYPTILSDWKHGTAAPHLMSLEAFVQAMGYELRIVPGRSP